MSLIKLIKYIASMKQEWDNKVITSINGTFLLNRDYMDYHQDRFIDDSLMFYSGSRLIALLPGHIEHSTFCSHNGLTYGGLVYDKGLKYSDIEEIYNITISYLSAKKVNKIVVKPIPYIYSQYASDEQLYYFFSHNFNLTVRNLSSVIPLNSEFSYSLTRRRGIKKGSLKELVIVEDQRWEEFWNLLEENLRIRHAKRPVHAYSEIIKLKQKFPDQIKLFTISLDSVIRAGVLLYLTERVVHSQYTASDQISRSIGALDVLYHFCIDKYKNKYMYFDFGHSNEEKGKIINNGLIYQKEGFGARGVIYDTYEMEM